MLCANCHAEEHYGRVTQLVACQSYKLEVEGSTPSPTTADVAQMAERLFRKQEDASSTLVVGTDRKREYERGLS